MPIQYGLLTKGHLEVLAPMLPEVRRAADENNVYAVGAVKDGCLCGVLVFRAGGGASHGYTVHCRCGALPAAGNRERLD